MPKPKPCLPTWPRRSSRPRGSPRTVKIVLINDDLINAFVAGGQIVYVHSGLLQAADNVNEVQGVVAHELGHIADGHVVLGDAAMKPAMGMYLLSMVLGLAAMAAGGGAAGAGIMAAGQQAAMGKVLSFSRTQNPPPTRPARNISTQPASPARGC